MHASHPPHRREVAAARPARRASSSLHVCCLLALASLLFAWSVTSMLAQSKRAMTVDDVIDLVQVSQPRISPDGRRVLYTVSELGKWKDNKRVTSIWIVDADGSNARRFLGNEKDRSAAWSPDGRTVAFLRAAMPRPAPAAVTATTPMPRHRSM